MPAHPWLQETPWPTKPLPRDQLTARIEHLLAINWMGVLCTLGKDGPIGSPVEYYAEGNVVYILPQPGSPKLKAMERDPASVSLCTQKIPAGPVCAAPNCSATPNCSTRGHRKTITP